MNNIRRILLLVILLLLVVNPVGYAQTILDVPFDNRSASLGYVTDAVTKGGI